jgi:hypothetical protein
MVFLSHLVLLVVQRNPDLSVDLLGNPVHSERDENEQANYFTTSTISDSIPAVRIGSVRCILYVYRNKSDRVPCTERRSKKSSNERNNVGVSVLLRHIDSGLQHKDAERDPGNPADEAEDVEHAEQQEHYASRPVFPREHVDGRYETEDDVEYASDPDELLSEGARSPHVQVTENDRHAQHEGEEDNGVGVEGEFVCVAVDASAVGSRCVVLAIHPYTP